MLTLFARVVANISKCNDFLVGTSISGRNLPVNDINNIIGCVAKSLPLCITLTGSDLTKHQAD